MPTDVLMPAIDPVYPAELSHIFMTDILRKQFGYDGVVLTDALYMQGITQKWNMYQAAVMALNVGNDMLLGPTGADQMLATIDAMKAALQIRSLLTQNGRPAHTSSVLKMLACTKSPLSRFWLQDIVLRCVLPTFSSRRTLLILVLATRPLIRRRPSPLPTLVAVKSPGRPQ